MTIGKQIAESRALAAIIEDSTFEMSQSMINAVSQDIKQQELQQIGDYHCLQTAMKNRTAC